MKTSLPAQIAGLMRNIETERPLDAESDVQYFTLAAALASCAPWTENFTNSGLQQTQLGWDLKTWVKQTNSDAQLVSYDTYRECNTLEVAESPTKLEILEFSTSAPEQLIDDIYIPEINELEDALRLNQITLLYQPTVDIATGRIVELDAIPHWHHMSLGLIPLKDVSYGANKSFQEALAKWAFATASKQLSIWRETYAGYSNLGLTGTACGVISASKECVDQLVGSMLRHGLRPSVFSAQVDSNSVLARTDGAQEMVTAVTESGFQLTLDGFEGGIDAISAIKNLPIRTLRLSKEFTQKVGKLQVDPTLSRSVIGLAKSMNLRVVALGVVNAMQLKRLRSFGCDIAQGDLFAKPLSAEQLEPLLSQRAVFFQLVDSINDIPGGN